MTVTTKQLQKTYGVDGSTRESAGESGGEMSCSGAPPETDWLNMSDENGIGWQLLSFISAAFLLSMLVAGCLGMKVAEVIR